MITSTQTIGRFTPPSRADFSARAKNLSKLLQRPFQQCQERLAQLYGYADLHDLQAAIARVEANPSLTGPYDAEKIHAILKNEPSSLVVVGRFNATLQMAFEMEGVDISNGSRRAWDARELGLFECPATHRVKARTILAKHNMLDDAETGAHPHHDYRARDYAEVIYTQGLAIAGATPLGAAINDALLDLRFNHDDSPECAENRDKLLDQMIRLHPNNPWILADRVTTDSHRLFQGPWASYQATGIVPDGSTPASNELRQMTKGAGELILKTAERAISLFEEIYGEAEIRSVESEKLFGSDSAFAEDANSFQKTLYWAGMIASNSGKSSRMAETWLKRSLHFQDRADVRERLAFLAFCKGNTQARRWVKGLDTLAANMIRVAEAIRDGNLQRAVEPLQAALRLNMHIIGCFDPDFRSCDHHRTMNPQQLRITLDEVLWHTGDFLSEEDPKIVDTLSDILDSKPLRDAYITYWDATSASIGCAQKGPSEYHRFCGDRQSKGSELDLAVIAAIEELG